MNQAQFGIELRQARERKPMSRIELQAQLGFDSTKQIERWEAGKALPTHEMLEKLCGLFQHDFISTLYDVKRKAEEVGGKEGNGYQAKYERVLEKQNDLLTDQFAKTNKEIVDLKASLAECHSMLASLAAMVATVREIMLAAIERQEKRKTVRQEAHKIAGEQFAKLKKQGIDAVDGK